MLQAGITGELEKGWWIGLFRFLPSNLERQMDGRESVAACLCLEPMSFSKMVREAFL